MAKAPIRIKFGDAPKESTFASWPIKEPIEFTIYNITQEKGKESGEPYLKFEFKQADGGNRKAWRNFSLQTQSLWVLKRLLVQLGMDKDELEQDFDFDPQEILGQTVWLKFGPERDYNGRTSQDVDEVLGVLLDA